MAKILGKFEECQRHEAKFQELKARFNELYYIESEADYTPKCQSGVVFPLAFGLAPENDRAEIAETLHKYVQKADYHFTTGFMTSERILGLLCDFGYENDALKIIKSRTYPSILDMISSGATTTTENWTGHRETFKYDSMNHYAFGGFSRWFFEHLGGIKILAPGFEKIRLAPCMFRELSDFAVSYKTEKGTLKSSWSYDKARESFIYKCSIPDGITATLKLPEREEIEVSGELCFDIRN